MGDGEEVAGESVGDVGDEALGELVVAGVAAVDVKADEAVVLVIIGVAEVAVEEAAEVWVWV